MQAVRRIGGTLAAVWEPTATGVSPLREISRLTLLLRSATASLFILLALPVRAATEAAGGRLATPPAGAIAGRVQNVATGQFLNNARVAVKDSNLVAFTDQTGSYRLSEVPSGPVVLEVFFAGSCIGHQVVCNIQSEVRHLLHGYDPLRRKAENRIVQPP